MEKTPSSSGEGEPSKEELKRAIQAFRKRLKLYQLDDESKIGHSAMSSGGKSGIVGIRLPSGFAPAVWEKLVAQGKLKYMGNDLYGRGTD